MAWTIFLALLAFFDSKNTKPMVDIIIRVPEDTNDRFLE